MSSALTPYQPRATTPRVLAPSPSVPIDQISRLVGHSDTRTTGTVYRKQIRPVLVRGADAMDLIFPTENHDS